jgi:hypothetical protein
MAFFFKDTKSHSQIYLFFLFVYFYQISPHYINTHKKNTRIIFLLVFRSVDNLSVFNSFRILSMGVWKFIQVKQRQNNHHSKQQFEHCACHVKNGNLICDYVTLTEFCYC